MINEYDQIDYDKLIHPHVKKDRKGNIHADHQRDNLTNNNIN